MSTLNCLIIRRHIPDLVAWSHSRNVNFSVKSLLTSLEDHPTDTDSSCDILWRGCCPPKMEIFSWQLFRGRLLVRDVLARFESCVDHSKPKTASLTQWVPPHLGDLKFNVDCSARGKSGPAEIGGVLRDSTWKPLCIFSAFVGISESNSAEILAIHKACALCASKPSFSDRIINIIRDSKVAVAWINNPDYIGSFNHISTIYNIMGFLYQMKGLKIVYNLRSSNSFADSLAKKHASGADGSVVWDYTGV
ncbi:hypothetical protein Dsin_016679 [Dipteronia sinensis]|uniref:RNase H type-1 domain-containing protein n=1 Tax=Dipteronia sinensis TaxID=43782 RepID=A0AAE0E770_9ROSI|nr:hypothetical protein Dsin_016679 [Dipteronia sinensis]